MIQFHHLINFILTILIHSFVSILFLTSFIYGFSCGISIFYLIGSLMSLCVGLLSFCAGVGSGAGMLVRALLVGILSRLCRFWSFCGCMVCVLLYVDTCLGRMNLFRLFILEYIDRIGAFLHRTVCTEDQASLLFFNKESYALQHKKLRNPVHTIWGIPPNWNNQAHTINYT